jgi:hypothetical protein
MSCSILITTAIDHSALAACIARVGHANIEQVFFHSEGLDCDWTQLSHTLSTLAHDTTLAYCGSALTQRNRNADNLPNYIAPLGLTEFFTRVHVSSDFIQL